MDIYNSRTLSHPKVGRESNLILVPSIFIRHCVDIDLWPMFCWRHIDVCFGGSRGAVFCQQTMATENYALIFMSLVYRNLNPNIGKFVTR